MHRFAFIIHPLSLDDVARKYQVARYLPAGWVKALLRRMKPQVISEITGVRSATGAETAGWFIGCPLTSEQLLGPDVQGSLASIIACGEIAAAQGAEIVGLGALTSVVGDAGITVAQALDIGVTTGNSYTVATAVEGALQAAAQVGLDPAGAHAAILGATGSIGRVCAHLLADQVATLTLAARHQDTLEQVAAELSGRRAQVSVTTDLNQALREADLVIAVTAAVTRSASRRAW